jgi:hypothetical protein
MCVDLFASLRTVPGTLVRVGLFPTGKDAAGLKLLDFYYYHLPYMANPGGNHCVCVSPKLCLSVTKIVS